MHRVKVAILRMAIVVLVLLVMRLSCSLSVRRLFCAHVLNTCCLRMHFETRVKGMVLFIDISQSSLRWEETARQQNVRQLETRKDQKRSDNHKGDGTKKAVEDKGKQDDDEGKLTKETRKTMRS